MAAKPAARIQHHFPQVVFGVKRCGHVLKILFILRGFTMEFGPAMSTGRSFLDSFGEHTGNAIHNGINRQTVPAGQRTLMNIGNRTPFEIQSRKLRLPRFPGTMKGFRIANYS